MNLDPGQEARSGPEFTPGPETAASAPPGATAPLTAGPAAGDSPGGPASAPGAPPAAGPFTPPGPVPPGPVPAGAPAGFSSPGGFPPPAYPPPGGYDPFAAPGSYGPGAAPGSYGPGAGPGGYGPGPGPGPGGYAAGPGYPPGGPAGPGYPPGRPAGPGGPAGPGYGPPGASGPPGGYAPSASQAPAGGYPPAGGYAGSGYGPGGYPGSYPQPQPGGYGAFGGPAQPYLGYGTAPRRPRRGVLAYILVALLAATAGAGTVLLAHSTTSPASSGAPRTGTGGTGGIGSQTPGRSAGVGSSTVRNVTRAVAPGLVKITSNLHYQGGKAYATGMVISKSGLVLTNNHVIDGTNGLTVTVFDTGKRFAAKWLGYDRSDDVAVLQLVGASGLHPVPLGNSATVRPADSVVALGNAGGTGRITTVTGTITGLNRTITASDNGQNSETLHGMLQTSAHIVPGDSGGSLVSTSGRVIGMDTAAASSNSLSGGQSVGFAIPINKAMRIARHIIAGQSSASVHIGSSGFLGVLVAGGQASSVASPATQRRLQLQQQGTQGFGGGQGSTGHACITNDLSPAVPAKAAPVSAGALVLGDLCGTPSVRAHIYPGDVITKVGGHQVTTPDSLSNALLTFRAGASAPVTWVDTSGHAHTSKLVLAQAPPK